MARSPELPEAHFGPIGETHQRSPAGRPGDNAPDDDAELRETPADVVALLGFDPLDIVDGTITKEAADYQDSPSGDERCGLCSMFRAPVACTLVEGRISPRGWCEYFEERDE